LSGTSKLRQKTEEGHDSTDVQVTTADQGDRNQVAQKSIKNRRIDEKLDADLACSNLQTPEMNCDIWISAGTANMSTTTHWQFLKGGCWLPMQSKALSVQHSALNDTAILDSSRVPALAPVGQQKMMLMRWSQITEPAKILWGFGVWPVFPVTPDEKIRCHFFCIRCTHPSCCTALEFNPTLAISKSNNSSRIVSPSLPSTTRCVLYMSAIPTIRFPPILCLTGPTTSCPPPLWNYALWQVISVLGMSLEQVIPPRMLSTRRDCACSASRHQAYDVSFLPSRLPCTCFAYHNRQRIHFEHTCEHPQDSLYNRKFVDTVRSVQIL